jgi:hypothetical protein
MGAADITPVVTALTTAIRSVPSIGLVWPHDIYSHDDLRPLIVSNIAGVNVMRAWWITGPTMTARNMTQISAGHVERSWTYTIHGIEGLSADGDSLLTVRTNALAVSDAIDVSAAVEAACHRTQPCTWRTGPENRVLLAGIACSYVELQKQIVTVSTP